MWSVIFCVMLLLYLASISIFDAPDTVVLSKRSDDNHIRRGSFDCDCSSIHCRHAVVNFCRLASCAHSPKPNCKLICWSLFSCSDSSPSQTKSVCLLCRATCHLPLPIAIAIFPKLIDSLCCVLHSSSPSQTGLDNKGLDYSRWGFWIIDCVFRLRRRYWDFSILSRLLGK